MAERKSRPMGRCQTSNDLLKEAWRNPGIAEMMKVYRELERVVQGTAPYVAAAEEQQVLLASTSSDR